MQANTPKKTEMKEGKLQQKIDKMLLDVEDVIENPKEVYNLIMKKEGDKFAPQKIGDKIVYKNKRGELVHTNKEGITEFLQSLDAMYNDGHPLKYFEFMAKRGFDVDMCVVLLNLIQDAYRFHEIMEELDGLKAEKKNTQESVTQH